MRRRCWDLPMNAVGEVDVVDDDGLLGGLRARCGVGSPAVGWWDNGSDIAVLLLAAPEVEVAHRERADGPGGAGEPGAERGRAADEQRVPGQGQVDVSRG